MKYGIWFIATELIFFSFIYLMFGEEVAKRAFLSLHSVAIGLIGIGYLTGFWDALGVWRHSKQGYIPRSLARGERRERSELLWRSLLRGAYP
ncbi:MAG: hypothetical protein UY76_C0028G0010 [Candidatus Uhrbacteria bacterium GW2011_GWA2_52_8d]|uniref:Uncharacterized protein n=1 Tax=Candidatus Uhrbacteria bacterium GW2011_GWA2_52_8d TaxID=1618979 RepID=A0A0G2AIK8_9BACT|nr:MAG: hypothetical protein UY76_C0028G0010 [Candidatus Uhrbacteria bacterium GW2011_GWA2_52_8d]